MLPLRRAAAPLLAAALLSTVLAPGLPAAAAEPVLTTGFTVDVAPAAPRSGYLPFVTSHAATSVAATSAHAGGVSLSGPSGGYAVLAPPSGQQLVAGGSFAADAQQSASTGVLQVPAGCGGIQGQVGRITSRVEVRSVTYGPDGVPSALVADYDGSCANNPSARVSGVLRIGASAPYVHGSAARREYRSLAAAPGAEVRTTVVITSKGPTATTVGAAVVGGERAAEYAVVADRCAGAVLQPDATCEVEIAFRPAALGFRPGLLSVPMTGHPRPGGVLLPLDGGGVTPPAPPDLVRGFASTQGAGVMWRGPGASYALSYRVYRDSGSGPVLLHEVTGAQRLGWQTWVDATAAAGATASYSVAAVSDGGEGERSVPAAITRLAVAPQAGSTRAMAMTGDGVVTSGASADVRRAGETVSAVVGGVRASSPTGSVGIDLPALPGPGSWSVVPTATDPASGSVAVSVASPTGTCSLSSGTIRVDDVAYDEALKPVVLAAEVDGVCGGLGRWHAVVRYDSSRGYRAADVTRETFANTVLGTSTGAVVTVTNRGDLPLTPGPATLSGKATADWTVGDGCRSVLAAGTSCRLPVTFTPTAGGPRDAFVRVPLDTAVGSWSAALIGQSVTVPEAPNLRSVTGVGSTAVLAWDSAIDPFWTAQTFTVRRTVGGTTSTVATLGAITWTDPRPVDGALYTVSATNVAGEGPRSAARPVSWVGSGSLFTALTSTRLLDTRSGTGAPKGAVPAGGSVRLQVTGTAGVPVSGVTAVALNVTAVGATATGFVTVHPTGQARPLASSLNTTRGLITPNLVVVKVGTGGTVQLFNSSGSTHLLADVAGYWTAAGSYHPGTTATMFTPLSPRRLLDTRNGTGALQGAVGAGRSVRLQVNGTDRVPTDDVAAVVLNVTAVGATASGFVTAHATGTARPDASNLNTSPGRVTPNLVVVPLRADGSVELYNSAGSVHLLADVAGFFSRTGSSDFHPLSPTRVLDTRDGTGAPRAAVLGGRSVPLQVTGRGGVPSLGVTAVVLNVTAVGATANGFVTAFPAGQVRPEASSLNTTRGLVMPNLVVVEVGAGGVVQLFNSLGSVHLLADVAGYYTR